VGRAHTGTRGCGELPCRRPRRRRSDLLIGRGLLFRALLLALVAAGRAAGADVRALAVVPERPALPFPAPKVESRLRDLAWGMPRSVPASPLVPVTGLPASGPVRVFVRVGAADDAGLAALRAAGLRIEMLDPGHTVVQGLVEPADVPRLAALDVVRAIRPVEHGRLATGAVTSEGDTDSHADQVRALGYDGTGITVAVISDGIDHAASAQATGDLPPAVTVPSDARCVAGSGDEGTALLEIVHDLAPGAALMFAGGAASSLVFVNAVDCLVAAGAKVIVDDLLFFDQPFFADGPVATAVRAAVQAGVSYHTAAGNEGQQHVMQDFRASPSSDFHDFLGGPVDNTDDILVPPGVTLSCFLQWNDPFGGSANDYNLFILDAGMNVIAQSTTVQNGTQDPVEVAAVKNTSGSAQVAGVAIARMSGAVRRLELFCLDGVNEQYVTPGSIISQGALPEVVTVAAIDVSDPGLADVEPFSSQGPAQIFFPAAASRPKPDIAGFDGVSITNAGGFPACPPNCAFFGTSAAAPHVAAVAALLLQKNPFVTPATIANALRNSAVDVGPVGFDNTSGAGRLDALAAAGAVSVPECFADATCDDANLCTDDACTEGTCVHPAHKCDDGNACNGVEGCDPALGCIPGTPLACSDGDPCTTDGCDPVHGCVFAELPGLDFVSCALESHLRPLIPPSDATTSKPAARIAKQLLARLGRAEALVTAAQTATPRHAARMLTKARHLVLTLAQLARAKRRTLGVDAAQAIIAEAQLVASHILAVRLTL
jgi:subtilisin family serine protease